MTRRNKSKLLLKTIKNLQDVQTNIPMDGLYIFEVKTAIETLIDIKNRIDNTDESNFALNRLFGLMDQF